MKKKLAHKFIQTLSGIVYLYTILIFQDGKEFASNNGLMFTEVSAKTGMNVDDVFTNLGQYIHCTVQLNIHTNNTYLQIHTYTL